MLCNLYKVPCKILLTYFVKKHDLTSFMCTWENRLLDILKEIPLYSKLSLWICNKNSNLTNISFRIWILIQTKICFCTIQNFLNLNFPPNSICWPMSNCDSRQRSHIWEKQVRLSVCKIIKTLRKSLETRYQFHV